MLAVEVFFASIISGMATLYVAIKKSDEIIVIRSGSEITEEEWFCRQHRQWNCAGDECNCCERDLNYADQ